MLDIIGAGATATTTIDWHDAWNRSEEAAKFKIHLEEIHEEGRKRPPVQARSHHEFATSWWFQLYELTVRANIAYWRNPTYIMAKQFLNIAAGLFIGFTFFKAGNSIQGTQNKIFVRSFPYIRMLVLIVPLPLNRLPSCRLSSQRHNQTQSKLSSSTSGTFMRYGNAQVECTAGLRG